MFVAKTAEREQVKLMLGVTGPSGAGKTLSSLLIAYGLTKDWTKIILADTENRSALYYAGDKTGPWKHLDFPPTLKNGYHPDNWCALIDYAQADPDCEVLILDSITHEWNGVGGCLDTQTRLGGRFEHWAKVTPMHNRFIDKMRNSNLHIIATMRSKQDYTVELNEKGKNAPTKVGLASIQREGTDYEFGVIFDMGMNHYAKASKDRTGLFAPKDMFQIGSETGEELLAWVNSGKAPVIPIFDKENVKQVDWLKKKVEEKYFTFVLNALHGKVIDKNSFNEVLEIAKTLEAQEG